jgi:hypothetical protein
MSGGGVAGTVTLIADPFGQVSNDCQPFPFGPLGLMQLSAGCDPLIGPIGGLTAEFDQVRAELLAGPMSEESINGQLDTWTAQIADSVAEAADAHADAPSVDTWNAAVETLRTDVIASRSGTGR